MTIPAGAAEVSARSRGQNPAAVTVARRGRATRPALLAATLMIVILGVVAGCGEPDRAATGLVISLQTEGTAVTGFTLRTDSGEVIQFRVGSLDVAGGSFQASHLAVHAANLQPIAVRYRLEEGVAVADKLVDAPGSPASP